MYRNVLLPLLALALLLPLSAARRNEEAGIFDSCRQLVVVVSPGENSVNARLYKFEKTGKNWLPFGQPHAVNLGKKGLAWGKGLHSSKPGMQKKEGDARSPAGIFRFGTAFGAAPAGELALKIPYIPITEAHICVEDSDSRYYNQIVDATQVPKDWKNRESMMRKDGQYKWGIVVKQNTPPEPEGGSCIFFHIWRAPGSGTLGCTAMTETDLLSLMQWLDPKKEPLLVQMTEDCFQDYQKHFFLPLLETLPK